MSADAIAEITFWQQEAHYFEERARVQGTSATQTVTISIATLVLGTVPIAFQLATPPTSAAARTSGWFDLLPYFLVAVPLIALLLWMTSLRFLTEMFRLDVYYMRADAEVRRIRAQPKPGALAYATWGEDGAAQARWWGYLAWVILALVVQGFAIWLYLAMFAVVAGPTVKRLLGTPWTYLVAVIACLACVAIILIVWEFAVSWIRNVRAAKQFH